jgi:endonuclease/exonuclease/phosphatase family metal-dependent hydrolase
MNHYYRFCLTLLGAFLLVNCHYGQSYTFMTYNIRYDNPDDGSDNWNYRKQDMVRFIESTDPLVFGIQEGLTSQVGYLHQELEEFDYIGVGRDDGQQKGEYCAVFYQPQKIRLLESGTFWLSESPNKVSVGWDAALPRICTYGLFEDSDRNKFWVFNTHFDHRGVQARKQSASLIIDQINTINDGQYPVVLMGDFNATPTDDPIKVIASNLDTITDGTESLLSGPIGTYNGFKQIQQDRRIDFIFTEGFQVESYLHANPKTIQGHFLSDHLPVIVQAIID